MNYDSMKELISLEWLWGALGAGAMFIVRMMFDKRKLNAENRQEEAKAKETEVDADTKAVELYERFASQLVPRMESLQNSYDNVFQEFQTLRREYSDLKFDYDNLKRENKILRTENSALKDTNVRLTETVKSIKEELNSIKEQMVTN